MDKLVEDVVNGLSEVFIRPIDSGIPSDSPDMDNAWDTVGYVNEDGLELTITREDIEIRAAKYGTIGLRTQDVKGTADFNLMQIGQSSFNNIGRAFGYDVNETGTNDWLDEIAAEATERGYLISHMGAKDCIIPVQLCFKVPLSTCNPALESPFFMYIQFYKAFIGTDLSMSFKDSEITVLPMSYQLFQFDNADEDELTRKAGKYVGKIFLENEEETS
jgi:hypothetical protein